MRDDRLIPEIKRNASVMLAFVAVSTSAFLLLNLHEKYIRHQAEKRAEESSIAQSEEEESIKEERLNTLENKDGLVKENTGSFQRKSAEDNIKEIQKTNVTEDKIEEQEKEVLLNYGNESFMPVLNEIKSLYETGNYQKLYEISDKELTENRIVFTGEQVEKASEKPLFITNSRVKAGLPYHYVWIRPDEEDVNVLIKAEDKENNVNYFKYFTVTEYGSEWKLSVYSLCDSVYGNLTVPSGADNISINNIDCSAMAFTDNGDGTKTSDRLFYMMFSEGENTISYTVGGEKKTGIITAYDPATGKETDDPQMLKKYEFSIRQ